MRTSGSTSTGTSSAKRSRRTALGRKVKPYLEGGGLRMI
jgi:hypothetical protein